MGLRSYNSKVVISGDIVEIYKYKVPVLEGFENSKSKGKGRSCVANEKEKKLNRILSLNRSRRDLRRLVNCNINKYGYPSKFITLTFNTHVTDFKISNYEFKKFRQRLEYMLGFKMKYVVVPEFTKRGRIHFHVIMFNVPFIKNSVLREVWSNGFIKINKIDSVDNVGAYICKYMTKDNTDSRLKGKKCYFSSRGLLKPIEIKEKSRVENLSKSLPTYCLVYSKFFENEYNSTLYNQYNMSLTKKEDLLERVEVLGGSDLSKR